MFTLSFSFLIMILNFLNHLKKKYLVKIYNKLSENKTFNFIRNLNLGGLQLMFYQTSMFLLLQLHELL